jgi:DNA-binding NarL/FixJ family response regulator
MTGMEKQAISIVIVDDEALILSLLNDFLENEEDINVLDTFTSGTDFLEYMKNEDRNPDIVLMDLRMKGMDGVDTTLCLKDQWPEVKVISISSFYKKSFMGFMMRSGVSAFLPKELSPEKLVSVIHDVNKKGYYFMPDQIDVMREQFASNIPQPELDKSNSLLSEREEEVLRLICKQLTAQEIADKLSVSKRTVDGHRNNIFAKTGVKNLAGLVLYAVKNGIIRLDTDDLLS